VMGGNFAVADLGRGVRPDPTQRGAMHTYRYPFVGVQGDVGR